MLPQHALERQSRDLKYLKFADLIIVRTLLFHPRDNGNGK